MIPASLQPPTPHSFYKSVWLKIVAAIYNGAKHYSNRNSAIHAYALSRGVRRKFSWGGLVQGHMVVICIWCALFVTSQFDVMFQTNVLAKFVDIIMHIFLHALPLFHVSLH